MEILVIGLNHRAAPLALRERLALAPESAARLSMALRAAEGRDTEDGALLRTFNAWVEPLTAS